jgi:predicted AlkP superfamily pyrophosphatase or phosphodiesterase
MTHRSRQRLPLTISIAAVMTAMLMAAPDRTPKLVVLVMVDQFRADYVERFQSQWSQGLKRLINDGAWFRQASYQYANTVTCAGHASVSTGSVPATHGLILNAWWDRASGATVTCTADPSVTNLGYGGPAKGGDSLASLRTSTLADELRAQLRPASHAIAFSLKARAAAPLAGHRPDAVVWFDDSGTWTPSTAFAPALVPQVRDFIAEHPVQHEFGKRWERTLPKDAYLFEESAIGITAPEGMSVTFPHVLNGAGSGAADAVFYQQWQSSPFSDEYLARMALDVAGRLRFNASGSTNLLGISFSALDKVGHDFGPNSHEVQDVLIRLDRTLGSLMAGLDRLVGAGNYTLALTADHGVAPIPERARAEGLSAGRIDPARVVAELERVLASEFGPGPHVAQYEHTEVYLEPGLIQKVRSAPVVLEALRAAVRTADGVADLLDGANLDRVPSRAVDLRAAFARSHFAGRSGDLTVVYEPYWVDSETGTSHGTPFGYDARVPLFLFGKGIAPGEYLAVASPTDIAPTLAFLAGITLPRADGRVLDEALTTAARATHASSLPR